MLIDVSDMFVASSIREMMRTATAQKTVIFKNNKNTGGQSQHLLNPCFLLLAYTQMTI
jgi:hypothetical protein